MNDAMFALGILVLTPLLTMLSNLLSERGKIAASWAAVVLGFLGFIYLIYFGFSHLRGPF
jgi:TRAP-type C4-dicarboxylate transport system permease small subunit